MSGSEYHDVMAARRTPTRQLRTAAPEVWHGFAALHAGAMAEGAVSSKTKELMALAIAVIQRCDGCIAAHARAAARHGASPYEVAEALGVALLMGGGPVSVYAPRAWAAFREFDDRPPLVETDATVMTGERCASHERSGEEAVLVAGRSHAFHLVVDTGSSARTRCGDTVAPDAVFCPRVVAEADGFTMCEACGDTSSGEM